jgi:hypothetical protein
VRQSDAGLSWTGRPWKHHFAELLMLLLMLLLLLAEVLSTCEGICI